jgi:hypothetical protein
MPKDMAQDPEVIEIDAQKLRSLLDTAHNMKQASSESSSELRHHRKNAAEQLKITKDVWAMVERIDSMSDDKLAEFIRSIEPAFAIMMPQWKDRIQDMVDKAEAQTADMEGSMG